MNKWVSISIVSLAGMSLFSLYVASHIAQGIICAYVHLTPYVIPIAYVLGFFLGYAMHKIRKERNPKNVADLFESDEREVVLAALEGRTQADVTRELGKVKAHRTVKDLRLRGIVEREEKGKTYRLKPGKKLDGL